MQGRWLVGLPFCVALIIDVPWKWKLILVPLVAATVLVPFQFIDPATNAFLISRLCAAGFHALLALAFFIRLKLPPSML